MSKLLYFSALAEHSAEQLTKSREQWTAFLTTVARLYKYPLLRSAFDPCTADAGDSLCRI